MEEQEQQEFYKALQTEMGRTCVNIGRIIWTNSEMDTGYYTAKRTSQTKTF